jgi:hypothetical protein
MKCISPLSSQAADNKIIQNIKYYLYNSMRAIYYNKTIKHLTFRRCRAAGTLADEAQQKKGG